MSSWINLPIVPGGYDDVMGGSRDLLLVKYKWGIICEQRTVIIRWRPREWESPSAYGETTS